MHESQICFRDSSRFTVLQVVLLPWETVGVVEPNSQNMRSMRYLDFVSILFYGAMVLT